MQPDLELVHINKDESFAAWAHGYPFRTVRWHYHPEYEIHLVAATSGQCFIGDYIGRFEPGQLIMTGPNLPQNWISETKTDEYVPSRSLIIQFPEQFIAGCITNMQEMKPIATLLERSHRGLLFDQETSNAVRPLIERLTEARGVKRLALFFEILDILVNAPEPQLLASLSYKFSLSEFDDSGINRAIAHLQQHLTEELDEHQLAAMVGRSNSSFSRAFKHHTGTTFVRYRNQLRVDRACLALITRPDIKIAELCYEIGFSNLSNFNRHFQNLKGMSPRQFRTKFAANGAFKAHEPPNSQNKSKPSGRRL